MTTELTYVVITPYSLIKSRTGNIIARLMSLSGCDLVGIRMMRPSDAFVDEYIRRVKSLSISPAVGKALVDYIDQNTQDGKVNVKRLSTVQATRPGCGTPS